MRKKNRFSHSGESLVEIMVSAVVFLILVAILQGAIVFCTNAQRRSEQIREQNAEICQALRDSAYQTGGQTPAKMTFKAVSSDGSTVGTMTLFTIEVDLGTKEATYTDEAGASNTMVFPVFGPIGAAPDPGGGDAP